MAQKCPLSKHLNPVFIETGTFKGKSVKEALSLGFKKIYSIELKKGCYEKCKHKFRKQISKGTIELFLGDSSICLPEILNKVDQTVTFWLDAHYSGIFTARGPIDVPLMMELDAISKHHIKNHTILIDDVRLFGKKNTADWSNISLDAVIKALKKINPDYSIFYENGSREKDILVAKLVMNNTKKFFLKISFIKDTIMASWRRKVLNIRLLLQ